MKKSINFNQFVDGFRECGREDNFSYDGLKALFEYFECLEEDCGMEIEFDVVAICCEYTEDCIQYFADTYCIQGDSEEVVEYLRDYTQVIEINADTVIIQDF
jgi:hypothetical protein